MAAVCMEIIDNDAFDCPQAIIEPDSNEILYWMPAGGWNSEFTAKDRLICANLYGFLISKKKLDSTHAEQIALMMTMKQRHPHTHYSRYIEREITRIFTPLEAS